MVKQINKRLDNLEQVISKEQSFPGYIGVADESELEYLDLPTPVKAYIGISPDEWA